jgi:hypothetical protein
MGRRVLDLEKGVLVNPETGREETLTASEFDLLKLFADNPNKRSAGRAQAARNGAAQPQNRYNGWQGSRSSDRESAMVRWWQAPALFAMVEPVDAQIYRSSGSCCRAVAPCTRPAAGSRQPEEEHRRDHRVYRRDHRKP